MGLDGTVSEPWVPFYTVDAQWETTANMLKPQKPRMAELSAAHVAELERMVVLEKASEYIGQGSYGVVSRVKVSWASHPLAIKAILDHVNWGHEVDMLSNFINSPNIICMFVCTKFY